MQPGPGRQILGPAIENTFRHLHKIWTTFSKHFVPFREGSAIYVTCLTFPYGDGKSVPDKHLPQRHEASESSKQRMPLFLCLNRRGSRCYTLDLEKIIFLVRFFLNLRLKLTRQSRWRRGFFSFSGGALTADLVVRFFLLFSFDFSHAQLSKSLLPTFWI